MTAAVRGPDPTLAKLFWRLARERGDGVALREKVLGIWRAITWRDFAARVRDIGLGLAARDIAVGDRVCILSTNNPEWVIADLAIIGAGAVSVGIYPTDAPAQVEYLLNDCRAKVIFVEDDEQLDKVISVRDRTPDLALIVVFDTEGLRDLDDPMVISLDALITIGGETGRARPDLWQARLDAPAEDDLAILVYTSGTTGAPKGAMLSHRNILVQLYGTRDLVPLGAGDERLSFLPLCHVAERIVGYYFAMITGVVVNFAESPETLFENVREVQPTVFAGVPRIFEKLYSAVTITIADATWLGQRAYRVALAVGARMADHRLEGTRPSPALRCAYGMCRWLVLRNIRQFMGLDRAKLLFTGAAPISPDLIRWYLALGFTMLEGYGQTECAGFATLMPADQVKLGSIGRAVPFNEIKISAEDEILIRGDNVFMGYYNQPERTRETIRDGWLHTGDVGRIDNQGYVTITDRMKDVIITAGGKNITPSEIENQLKFSPYISDAVVIGDGRKYLTCLLMIDYENVVKFAQDNDVPFTNFASLTRAKAVIDLIAREVDAVNEKFARVEGIKQFRLIDQELDPEDEELTPTMKLKRAFVNRKYKTLIESMYEAA